jgi:hypothetical protein
MAPHRLAIQRRTCYLLACSLVVLVACSANAGFGPFKPTFSHLHLAPLSLPHTQRLAGFSRLAPSTDPDNIYWIYAFVPGGQTTPHVALTIDGSAYVTQLDGSGARKLDLPYPCNSPGITTDGGWLACPNETDQSHDAPELQIASLSPESSFDVHVAYLAAGGFYLYPTWSPDGRMLAILHDQDNTSSGCAIGLYSSEPLYQSFTHVTDVTTTSKFQDDIGVCAVRDLSWSPDGRWLAIQTSSGLFLVPISSLSQIFAVSAGSTPSTVDLSDSAFDSIAVSPSSSEQSFWLLSSPTWDASTETLAYLLVSSSSSPEEDIVVYDPVLSHQRILLRIPLEGFTNDIQTVEHVDVIAWTPDGKRVLLVVGQSTGCVDCAVTYPSEVYLYTPSP